MQKEKLLLKLLSGKSDCNFDFNDLRKILLNFGFEERVKGSHHVFSKKGYSGIVNLQKVESKNAKPYQVKQARDFLVKNKIVMMKNENLKYEMIIFWSKEDDVFIAEIPELKGCVAHGDTRKEAMENVLQVVEAWLELAHENKWAIPKPKGRLIPA